MKIRREEKRASQCVPNSDSLVNEKNFHETSPKLSNYCALETLVCPSAVEFCLWAWAFYRLDNFYLA